MRAGEGVRDFTVRDRVAWAQNAGSYATHALVDASVAVPLPDGIDSRTGAALMLQGLTAHYLTHSTFPLRAGHTCLVHAAAGGVGLLLCQLAKARGARVFGTVSTEEKSRLAREAGAEVSIRYDQEDFDAAVRRLTQGRSSSSVSRAGPSRPSIPKC